MTAPPPSDTTPPPSSSSHTRRSSRSRNTASPSLSKNEAIGLADLALDQLVGVFGLGAERQRRGSRGLALAGAHEADEDKRYLTPSDGSRSA